MSFPFFKTEIRFFHQKATDAVLAGRVFNYLTLPEDFEFSGNWSMVLSWLSGCWPLVRTSLQWRVLTVLMFESLNLGRHGRPVVPSTLFEKLPVEV